MNFDDLTTEELLFACKHGLPLDAMYYTTEERVKLSEKAIEEKARKKLKKEQRKREVLFDDETKNNYKLATISTLKHYIFEGLYFDLHGGENVILGSIEVYAVNKDYTLGDRVHFIIVDMSNNNYRVIPYDNKEFLESDKFTILFKVVYK